MQDEMEFQKKVQNAVDQKEYLNKRDKQSQMMEQIQNVLEREQLMELVQRLIVELITKMTERFIVNMKRQVENEILKMRDTVRSTNHQRTYSAVDKDRVEDLVQRTLKQHDMQINLLLEHQAQLKASASDFQSPEKLEQLLKQRFDVEKNGIEEQIKSFTKNYNQKQSTIMQILNDLIVRLEKVESIPKITDKKKK